MLYDEALKFVKSVPLSFAEAQRAYPMDPAESVQLHVKGQRAAAPILFRRSVERECKAIETKQGTDDQFAEWLGPWFDSHAHTLVTDFVELVTYSVQWFGGNEYAYRIRREVETVLHAYRDNGVSEAVQYRSENRLAEYLAWRRKESPKELADRLAAITETLSLKAAME